MSHPSLPGRPLAVGALLLSGTLILAGCGVSGPVAVTAPLGNGIGSGGASSQVPAGAGAAPTPTSPGATTDPALVLQGEFVHVVGQVGPSVVVIETSSGLGSGIVFDDHGDIVTNAHVAAGASHFTVTFADGRRLAGKLVGTFAGDDIAVIRVPATNLRPATFGDSTKLQVGDIVLAVGNPLGLQSSVTEGIVSALGRTVTEPGGVALPNVIQTSAAINPGNSGGAPVDLQGDVVGIPTLAALDPQLGGSAPGIGFAIPSNVVVDIAGQLIAHGHVVNSHRAYLGVQAADIIGAPGVFVSAVTPGGPAAKAGITAGDLITAIDGKPTASASALATVLADLAPGQSVSVSIVRQSGSSATVRVTLGQLPG